MKQLLLLTGLFVTFVACQTPAPPVLKNPLIHENESRFSDLRQLTFSGENAEAYWNESETELIFQSKNDSTPCDQIFIMDTLGQNVRMVSNGLGRTTCSYFIYGTDKILYSSTQSGSHACPPEPDRSKGYVWPIYPEYEVYVADKDGSNQKPLTTTPGYDAEATVSADGNLIVFTSMRNGDLDIYTMDANGENVKQLTDELGYDGGPFFSYDGSKIVYRAYHPKTETEKADYTSLLKENIIRPLNFEIWMMNTDGSNKVQLTQNGMANFAPFFTPDNKKVIFSSNLSDTLKKREFDLYLVDTDGSGQVERVTYTPEFDGFPMFTRDGNRLVFSSNRNNGNTGSTNVFIARWKK